MSAFTTPIAFLGLVFEWRIIFAAAKIGGRALIHSVIFDMDGVLVDSEHAGTLLSKQVLRSRGIPAEYDDFKSFTGMGDDRFLSGVCEKYGFPYDAGMKQELYDLYAVRAKGMVKVFDWTREMLLALYEKEVPFAVASASDMEKVYANINCIGVDRSMFRAIATGSDVTRNKPHPDIFLKAAEKAGFAPQETVVVEDSLSGVLAAQRAKMKAIAVTTSFPKEKLLEAGANLVTENLIVLPSLLGIL